MKSLRVVLALLAAALAAVPVASSQAPAPRVLAIHFDNDVNPVTADYVVGELERAEEEGFAAAVIVLDTPGGLADSMRDIYQKQLALELPVLVYVPTGARAASAGVWIGQAADVLGMAPQSNLGSSTPVAAGGGEIPSDLRRKVINDAAKSLRALAEEHGRNGDWAEEAVRRGSNLTAREALERNVIDLVSPTLPEFLEQADGRRSAPKDLVVHTAGAEIVNVEMSLWKRILDTVIDPNIIVLLMSLGLLGITLELYNPGLIFPGTVGAICLILGLFGLQVLPISWAGILLMLLALCFFIADLFVTSHGALTLAGAASFVFGALILFDPAGPLYDVSLAVALGIAGSIALITAVALTKVVQARMRPSEVGAHSLVGTTGTARHGGQVFANGELWRARAADGSDLSPGDPVEIVDVDESLTLEVRKVGSA
ncbi:MAG: nodulation protein NfeD [Thermoleophilia bacterium]|nr:nodulation protein NfeD [Thermoleophilia bacterium]